MGELVGQLAETVDLLAWMGFFTAPCAMFGGMAAAMFARRKRLISTRAMFTLAGLVSLVSGYGAARVISTEAVEVLFVSLALASACLFGFFLGLRDAHVRSKVLTEPTQGSATLRDSARFHASLVAVGIAYAGVWSTFVTRGYPALVPDTYNRGILFALVALVLWTIGGLHLMVHWLSRANHIAWLSASHLVMATSASPAILGLAVTMVTGSRWSGFLLMPVSLLVLWLEMHRLEKGLPATGLTE